MKTQTLKGTTVLVGLAMAVVLAALGCRETMYPFARAFGSPPESELAQCREAFRLLQSCLATGRVQVQPVLFIEDGRRQWRHDLAQAIVTEAGAHTKANWVAVAPPRKLPSPQWAPTKCATYGSARQPMRNGSGQHARRRTTSGARKSSAKRARSTPFKWVFSMPRGRLPTPAFLIPTTLGKICFRRTLT